MEEPPSVYPDLLEAPQAPLAPPLEVQLVLYGQFSKLEVFWVPYFITAPLELRIHKKGPELGNYPCGALLCCRSMKNKSFVFNGWACSSGSGFGFRVFGGFRGLRAKGSRRFAGTQEIWDLGFTVFTAIRE